MMGMKSPYSIRVLKCENEACPTTYHRELPDIMIVYKRYDAESIEQSVERRNADITVAADQSTIWRWQKWFKMNAVHIVMALLSIMAAFGDNSETSSLATAQKRQHVVEPIDNIKMIVARKTKWLNEAARILVNSAKWKFNRSAFLSG